MLLQELYDLKLSDLPKIYDNCDDESRNAMSQCLFDTLSLLRTDYNKDKITIIVHGLEDYKRNIGRHIPQNASLIARYNDLEETITNLCSFYEIKRKYQPHYIKR